MGIDEDILLTDRISSELVKLTINRPPANALNYMLIDKLLSLLAQFAREAAPPAIILTGKGDRFFSAGGDIGEVVGPELALPRMRSFHGVLCALERYPGPIVSAVRGFAVGGALEFVLFSDYVVASTDAQFGFPEINHGLLPAAKGMRQAVAILGRRAAQTLLFSGSLVAAERAREIGIADEVVRSEEVATRARAVAEELRSKDLVLYAAIKRTLGRSDRMTDQELESMTLDDMKCYLERHETAEARARFLSRNHDKS
jgi:enoyl-CoA hydratase/carnithine racemase